ncbi:uncharacterized protein LOC107616151 [Arachis ipaensis]|uniref:uncharacterized protein LOC107616151 n=1 Tax=Arachis ipaensis TaxID=130454 RepID=UPI0007AFB582|nr:uncharacterized protein LOC107616151 [Arachis ipaensis]
MGELTVKKVLLDRGSSADVLFYSTFKKMHFSDNALQPSPGELVGFSGERVSDNMVGTVYADHKEAMQCYNPGLKATTKENIPRIHSVYNLESIPTLAELDPQSDNSCPANVDDLEKVQLGRDEQFTNIGSAFPTGNKEGLIEILKANADLFAWTLADIPGIDSNLICHRLAVNPNVRPIRQKKIKLGSEKEKSSRSRNPETTRCRIHSETTVLLMVSQCSDGYNQILMHPDDEEKIAFVTDQGNFCYKVMPFGQNTEATYQRLMDKVFKEQIGRNIEIYVDDMVVKSSSEKQHKRDLNEIFEQLKKHNMRLNTEKCAFGVQGGKFLRFLLTNRGIEANPDKCQAVINMQSPRSVKEVQQLTGRLTDNGKEQHPVYFVSKVLQSAETRYPMIEKLAFGLIITARRLRHYFQGHRIIVRTSQPFRQVLSKPDLAGRLTKWFIKLSEFDITYQSIGSSKAQALADFISEFTSDVQEAEPWELYMDGASNDNGCGAGILLKDNAGVYAEQSIKFLFQVTNNQAEYEALLAGLRLAKEIEVPKLRVYCDSLLVVQQERDWRNPLIHYLKTRTVLEGEPRSFKNKASNYTLIGNDLYRRGFSRPLLKCLGEDDAKAAVAEIHEGICGHHVGGRSLATKILRAGYYWPTLRSDCTNKVLKCDACQKCSPLTHSPAENIAHVRHLLAVPQMGHGYPRTISGITRADMVYPEKLSLITVTGSWRQPGRDPSKSLKSSEGELTV